MAVGASESGEPIEKFLETRLALSELPAASKGRTLIQ